MGAKCVLCCNILEHVADREAFARVCDQILSPGGTIVVSVPQSYPLHMDPIDTYYRPMPAEIAQLLVDPANQDLAFYAVAATQEVKGEITVAVAAQERGGLSGLGRASGSSARWNSRQSRRR